MQYDAHKKSAVVAYILWLLFGIFGAHRFYLGERGTGAAMLVITVLSFLLMFAVVGIFTIWITVVWSFVDLFLIPGIASKYNSNLAMQLKSNEA